jgi:2-polyprenyl-3-methyl-5-hydroxy-6-metoxy-1,4-benzoquinol methylase
MSGAQRLSHAAANSDGDSAQDGAGVDNAADANRVIYDHYWGDAGSLSDFIRYNPGARHRRRLVLDMLERISFASVLDVGCGDGALLTAIDTQFPGRRLAGCDISAAAVERNQRAFPNGAFHVVNLEHDAPSGSHDAVTCSEVLEHTDAPDAAFARLARAVAPGGHLVVTTPMGKVHATERHYGHVRHPTPGQLRSWATQASMRTVELWSWGFPTYAFTKWAANVNPEKALAQFGGARAYGVVEKAVSQALWLANFVNLRRSPLGVQLVGLFQKPAA